MIQNRLKKAQCASSSELEEVGGGGASMVGREQSSGLNAIADTLCSHAGGFPLKVQLLVPWRQSQVNNSSSSWKLIPFQKWA